MNITQRNGGSAPPAPGRGQARLRGAARALAITAGALAAAPLGAGAAGISPPAALAIEPRAAVGVALAAAALWLVAAGRGRALAAALAGALALGGAAALAASAGEPAARALLAPGAALSMLLAGLALLLAADGRARLLVAAQGMAALLALGGLHALLDRAAGPGGGGAAPGFAAALVALGCGVWLARPERGAMAVLSSAAPGGLALRLLLPFGVVLPMVLAAAGAPRGLIGADPALVLLSLLDLALFCALAAALNRYAARETRAAAEARGHAERAEALLGVARRLNAQLDLDAVLRTVVDSTSAALGAPAVSVALADAHGRRLTPAAETGLPEEARRALRPVPRAEHDASAARHGLPAVVEDLRAAAGVPNAEALALAGARTLVTVEMVRGGALVGTLTVGSRGAPRRFAPAELDLLSGLADHAAQAIANARLHATSQAQALATARLHATTERRMRNLRALHAIDSAILTTRSRERALEAVLEVACAELEVDVARLWLADQRALRMRSGPALGLRAAASPGMPLPRASLAERAADERRAVWRAGPPVADAPDLAAEGAVFVAAAPLIAGEALLGVLEVAQRAPREPDAEWLGFLATLAGQAAIAVDYPRALDELEQANSALLAAYDETLAGWARVLDLRDHDTAGHCERVTDLTARLARLWGVGEDQLVQVRRGALLHDVGKLGVPDAILRKPGALSAEERAVMECHPVYAYEWLAPIAFLRPALDIPFAHHERWDGAGYPRGLRGEEIPLSARLFAVVDVWDALTSNRPYRAAWAPERALAHLRAGAGTHFDPRAVQAFCALVDAAGTRERAVGE